jgi:hypothetical protein
MNNISVAGGGSGAGKTSLICSLLPYFPGYGAVKFSVEESYSGKQPLVVSEGTGLEETGKDSWCYLEAGARQVVFVRCRQDQLKQGVRLVESRLAGLPGVFWEGNRVIDFIVPGFIVFVVNKSELKPSAKLVLPRANLLVYNSQGSRKFIHIPFLTVLRQLNSTAPLISLKLNDLSPFEAERLAEIIKINLF